MIDRTIMRSTSARSAPSGLLIFIVQLSVVMVLLQSIFVSVMPLSFAAVPAILGIGVVNGGRRELRLMFLSVAVLIVFVSYALLMDVRLLDALKSGAGFEAFFASLIFFPILLRRVTGHSNAHYWLPQIIILAFFLLEFAQFLSLKELGVVNWRISAEQMTSTKMFFDNRPSGIFGEPSWFGLGLATLFRLTLIQRKFAILSTVLVGTAIFLSGSSLGLIAWGCTVIPLVTSTFRGSIGIQSASARQFQMFAATILIIVILSLIMVGLLYYSDYDRTMEILQKIGDPFGNASGNSRFVAPLYYVGEALSVSPLFGQGMHYIPEYLVGRTGASVLPFNVTIELGIAGLVFYGFIIVTQVLHYKTPIHDLLLCSILLVGLGLQYTAFQGALIAISIVASSLERLKPRRVDRVVS